MKGFVIVEKCELPELAADCIYEALLAESALASPRITSEWVILGEHLSMEIIQDERLKPYKFICGDRDDQDLLLELESFSSGGAELPVIEIDSNLAVTRKSHTPRTDSAPSLLASLLNAGRIAAAQSVAASLRQEFRKRSGPASSLWVENLVKFSAVCALLLSTQGPVFETPTSTLARRTFERDLEEFFSAIERSRLLLDNTRVDELVLHRLKSEIGFFRTGFDLFNYSKRTHWRDAPVFLWLAAFFHKVAKQSAHAGDGIRSISLLTRTLESYCLHQLISVGRVVFDGENATWTHSGTRVQGTGELWSSLVSAGNFNFLDSADLHRCGEVVKLRNRSLFGHGVQSLNAKSIFCYTSSTLAAIESHESRSDLTKKRWRTLVDLSQQFALGEIIRISCDLVLAELTRKQIPRPK